MEIIGINEENVKAISDKKNEDDWVLKYRLDSYKKFENLDMPSFGPEIDLAMEMGPTHVINKTSQLDSIIIE